MNTQIDDLTVTQVYDGDSFQIFTEGIWYNVRIGGIDAPERSQPFGDDAAFKLEQLLKNCDRVCVHSLKLDPYRRIVAEVWADELLVNEEMCRLGLAWFSPKSAYDCPNSAAMEKASKEAIAAERGLWARDDNIPPWRWRDLER